MTNTNKYLAFTKAVEYESFTKAGEVLNYSQSGISRMIKDLEEEWHVSLLERSNLGMQLTSEGMQLLPLAREICEIEHKLQEQVQEIRGVRKGLIRIGTLASVAAQWLPNIISKFNKDYPEIEYELLLGDYREIEEWVASGRADCGFVRIPTKLPLEASFLDKDRLMVVLPKDHPLAKRRKFPLKALEDYPFMLLENDGSTEITSVLDGWNIKPDVQFTSWDDYAILSMIERNLGIGILPELVLRRISGYAVVIKELEKTAYRSLAFVVRSKDRAPNAVLRFMEYLKYRSEDALS